MLTLHCDFRLKIKKVKKMANLVFLKIILIYSFKAPIASVLVDF